MTVFENVVEMAQMLVRIGFSKHYAAAKVTTQYPEWYADVLNQLA